MINSALQFVANICDQYLKTQFGLTESTVILNNVIEADGSVPQRNANKVVITLINIAPNAIAKNNALPARGNYAVTNPAERYDMDVLVTSSFNDYNETLKFLNAAISFFQANPVINAGNFPGFPAGLNQLELYMQTTNVHEIQNIWAGLGAKYRPSVLYKVKF